MSKIFIVDTNVLIAGLITKDNKSPTARILDLMLTGKILFLLSPELLKEYLDVLSRPKITKLHQLSEKEIDQILSEITANSIWQEVEDKYGAPDPGDNHLWNLLMKHPSYTLITGDLLLIEQAPMKRSVITPATFIKMNFKSLH